MGLYAALMVFVVAIGAIYMPPLLDWAFGNYEKDNIKPYNQDLWYTVNSEQLPKYIHNKFIELHKDTDTEEFLDVCHKKANQTMTEMMHRVIKYGLSFFLTKTAINGFLNRSGMFVFSTEQFGKLIGSDQNVHREMLLDVGAGDGRVTKRMSQYFQEIYTTELSWFMRLRLGQRGFNVTGADDWYKDGTKYDVISCLNLLDRCAKPLTMLENIRGSLEPSTGRLVVALVLPLNQYDEYETTKNYPIERLPVKGKSFEEQVTSMVEHVFKPAGFMLEKWTKLPYLCEGDHRRSYYKLKDAVFVLKINNDKKET